MNGRKIAIVGYSHYVSDHTQDSEDFTIECVRKLLGGEWAKDPIFFRLITKAFGVVDYSDLWPNIMFFNWAPTGMGGKNEKFDNLSLDLNKRAKQRFIEIIRQWQPDIVLLFSSKIRPAHIGLDFIPLPDPLDHFSVGEMGGTKIFRLRHTQGAKGDELRQAVSLAIDCE